MMARLASIILVACAANAQDASADKIVFQKVCGACHAITMVSDLKTEDEWSETVGNMVSIGAKGTEREFDRVLRYLARNFTKVNVNTATAAQIAPVLGVSAAVAQAFVDYRTQHGSFTSLVDIKRVQGMDSAEIDARKDRIFFR